MSEGDVPRPQAAWSSWGKRTSLISSFGRRLTRKHYFIGLAVLLVTTIFLANPYHTFVKPHGPQAAAVPQPDAVSLSVVLTPTPSPEAPSQVEKPVEEVASPPKEPEQKPPAEEPNPEPEEKKPEEAASDEKDKPAPDNKDAEFCTTWPVDAKGKYTPKNKPAAAKTQLESFAPAGGWKKPQGVRVVAMVFYGRRRNVDILDCYLRQNLVSNGGYLDEVWFMVHTEKKEDVDWLREFVRDVPGYTFMDLGACTKQGYGCMWEYAVEDDTIYIKIDDDIVSLAASRFSLPLFYLSYLPSWIHPC